jgi:tripartite-type tricarboxylate transporter receptor subunit TctC
MHGFAQALVLARRILTALALLLVLSAGHGQALAGEYPDHTVKIIVPFPAGGTADGASRS